VQGGANLTSPNSATSAANSYEFRLARPIFALSYIEIGIEHSIQRQRSTHKVQCPGASEKTPATERYRRIRATWRRLNMAPTELNFITGNANKLAEVKAILGDTIVLKNKNLDLTEIQGTVEEVSIDKCKRAAEIVRPILNHIDKIANALLSDRWTCSN
jgi:hypothetical protein